MNNRRTLKSKRLSAVEEIPANSNTDLVVKPERKRHRKKVAIATKRLMGEQDATLKKLAK